MIDNFEKQTVGPTTLYTSDEPKAFCVVTSRDDLDIVHLYVNEQSVFIPKSIMRDIADSYNSKCNPDFDYEAAYNKLHRVLTEIYPTICNLADKYENFGDAYIKAEPIADIISQTLADYPRREGI